MQDSKTLKEIVTNLRSQTSTRKRAVVVIDAGIATEENLQMLNENDFDYVCVSRCKLKDYRIDPTCSPVEIEYSFRTLKTDLDLRPIYHKKDPSTMAHLHGMEIIQAMELPDTTVSSTHIRTCLLGGNVKEANRMLSHFYRLEGKVIEGNHLGTKIGFPTANLEINDKNKIIPDEGIYASWVYWNQKKYGGMVYIGKRPTITAQGEERIEVHLFDFSGDLYGETLRLEFVEFLHKDKQFESVDDLKKQLFADKEMALATLAEKI